MINFHLYYSFSQYFFPNSMYTFWGMERKMASFAIRPIRRRWRTWSRNTHLPAGEQEENAAAGCCYVSEWPIPNPVVKTLLFPNTHTRWKSYTTHTYKANRRMPRRIKTHSSNIRMFRLRGGRVKERRAMDAFSHFHSHVSHRIVTNTLTHR